MASSNNLGEYIEEIDVNKLTESNAVAVCDEVMRKSSAIKVNVEKQRNHEKQEAGFAQSAANQAKYDEAGELEGRKQVSGTPEGEMLTEAAGKIAPALDTFKTVIEGAGARSVNPSQGAGADKAKKAGVLSPNGESFEDRLSALGKASIKTALGRPLTEKMGTQSASIKSLNKHATGIKESGVGTANLKEGGVQTVLSCKAAPANEAKFDRAKEIKRSIAPAPGGVGAASRQLAHNAPEHGPKFTLNDEESGVY